ncbi:MAG: nucleotide exchange factor GrpE [Streptosporangiales bacterium]|nr:nucleotide exchange factor GrpE [Streptosporangiales bacterium]
MSADHDDEVVRRLDELTDLFTRRLLDDRAKRETIDALRDELDHSRSGLAAEYLLPLVRSLALVVDRLDRYDGPDADFVTSVRAELLDLLATHGVDEIPAAGGFDASRHEAVGTRADDAAAPGEVLELRRRGYVHGATVLRPAQVVVNAAEDP